MVSQKIESVQFYPAPNQSFPPGFCFYPPGRRELPVPPEQHFLKILPFFFAFFHTAFFPKQKEGGEDYIVEKITKISKGIGHRFW